MKENGWSRVQISEMIFMCQRVKRGGMGLGIKKKNGRILSERKSAEDKIKMVWRREEN